MYPFLRTRILPPLRLRIVVLDEAEHFLHDRGATVATMMPFGIIQESAFGFAAIPTRNPGLPNPGGIDGDDSAAYPAAGLFSYSATPSRAAKAPTPIKKAAKRKPARRRLPLP
jgi:hypothetical protein